MRQVTGREKKTKTLDELGHPVGSGAWGLCMGFPFLAFWLPNKEQTNRKVRPQWFSNVVHNYTCPAFSVGCFGKHREIATCKTQMGQTQLERILCTLSAAGARATKERHGCHSTIYHVNPLSLASPPQGTALPQAGFQVRNHSSIRTEDGGETYRLPSFPTWQGLAFLNDKSFIVNSVVDS